jgi:fatty acid desaturase
MTPTLPTGAVATVMVAVDGRPHAPVRVELRRIASYRNAWSVGFLYVQIAVIVWASMRWAPWILPISVLAMGRAFAQLASLMHEAAHRLLFAHRGANDVVGRWLLGYPAFTPTDAYRRAHMAHHRQEFGPNEPDVALYAGYPIAPASFRRKLRRDGSGRTGASLMRSMLRGLRSPDHTTRTTVRRILFVQMLLIAGSVALGTWWLYPVLWLLPYLTVWRVINRLRSIAEHGGMRASDDRRETTHSVRQRPAAKLMLVPYNIGFHLAHHVDSGVPFRNLPALHRALRESGYVDDTLEYASYPRLWRALRSG